jgi:hypothetical protein
MAEIRPMVSRALEPQASEGRAHRDAYFLPAILDRTVGLTTAVAVALAIGVPAAIAASFGHELADGPGWLAIAACSLGPLSVPAVWALAPRGFSIERGALRVHRLIAPVEIPLARIEALGLVDGEAIRRSVRTLGVYGVFGNYGRFWSRDLGAFRLYARRTRGAFVVVDAEGAGRFVLAPSDARAFLEALRFDAPEARELHFTRADRAHPHEHMAVGMVAAVVFPTVIAATVLIAAWAMAPTSIAVRGDAVVIARRGGGATELPIARMRAARALVPEELRGLDALSRGSPGTVRYGVYESDRLGRFRLYALRDGAFVLLDGEDGRVVVTPDDPDRCLGAIRSRLARR